MPRQGHLDNPLEYTCHACGRVARNRSGFTQHRNQCRKRLEQRLRAQRRRERDSQQVPNSDNDNQHRDQDDDFNPEVDDGIGGADVSMRSLTLEPEVEELDEGDGDEYEYEERAGGISRVYHKGLTGESSHYPWRICGTYGSKSFTLHFRRRVSPKRNPTTSLSTE